MKLHHIHVTIPKAPKELLKVRQLKPKLGIQKGPSNRRHSKEKAYISYRQSHHAAGCDFCHFETNQTEDIVAATPSFIVVRNKFQYDIWDGCPVKEHLLVCPRRHIKSISEFTDSEKAAYMQLICDYEARGYSLYARSDLDKTKSISHQHTHLIRLEPRTLKAMVYLHTPHVLLYR